MNITATRLVFIGTNAGLIVMCKDSRQSCFFECACVNSLAMPHYHLSDIQDNIENANLRKEVGIGIKSNETSSQLKPVRNSYVATMHQPVTVSSNMEPNAYTNKAFYS